MSLRALIVLAVAFFACNAPGSSAFAQSPPPSAAELSRTTDPTLKVGMRAPDFKVERFLKGEPFTAFKTGRVYVVEFWATWCGPCIMSMPHLSDLQHEYRDKGVTIVGVNIRQEPEYGSGTLASVTSFVEKKGNGMAYAVAYDGASRYMDKTWMEASAQPGIPSSFVIDRSGVVAWIGHPDFLDMVLEEVVAEKWDIATGADRIKTVTRAITGALEKYNESLAAGDAAWDAAAKQYPAMSRTRIAERFGAMLAAAHTTEACTLGNQIVDKARAAKDNGSITRVLEQLSRPDVILKDAPAKALLVRAAEANFEFADVTQPGPYVVLARAYFISGRDDKGRDAAKKAVELSPEKTRPSMERWLKQIEEEAKKQ